MWSCGSKDTGPVITHENSRNNSINATKLLVSIEENLPDMHSYTYIIPAGDTLLIYDLKADLQFTAYDIYADTTLGQFGKFGNGPGEIANFASIFYNPNSKILYGHNANQNTISGFYLPRAVVNPDYDAFDKFKMGSSIIHIMSPNYLTDSVIPCTVYIPKGASEFQLANWNFNSNKVSPIDSVIYYDNARFEMTVSPENNIILTTDMRQDILSIYNFDGKLLRRIYGPDYGCTYNSKNRFFSCPVICTDKIAIIYSGPGANTPTHPVYNKIIINDINGKYIRTLDFDFSINSIAYHAKTNRLYMTTDGEPQFCYLPLDKL